MPDEDGILSEIGCEIVMDSVSVTKQSQTQRRIRKHQNKGKINPCRLIRGDHETEVTVDHPSVRRHLSD